MVLWARMLFSRPHLPDSNTLLLFATVTIIAFPFARYIDRIFSRGR